MDALAGGCYVAGVHRKALRPALLFAPLAILVACGGHAPSGSGAAGGASIAPFVGTWTCTVLDPDGLFASDEASLTLVDAGPSAVAMTGPFLTLSPGDAGWEACDWEKGVVYPAAVTFVQLVPTTPPEPGFGGIAFVLSDAGTLAMTGTLENLAEGLGFAVSATCVKGP